MNTYPNDVFTRGGKYLFAGQPAAKSVRGAGSLVFTEGRTTWCAFDRERMGAE